MATLTRQNLGQIAKLADVPITLVWKVMLGQGGMIDHDEFARIKAAASKIEAEAQADDAPNDESSTKLPQVQTRAIGVSAQTATKGIVLGYQGEIMEAITRAADPKQQLLVTYYYLHSDMPNMQDFIQHVDGLIVIGGAESQLAEYCSAAGHPYVLIDPSKRDIDALGTMIVVDNFSAIELLLTHLVNLGHQKIGMVTGQMLHVVAHERLEAFQNVLERLGLPQNPEWIASSEWTEQSGYESAMQILQNPDRPTAIVAANDLIAIGVIRAVRELGLVVGEDVSVTGFDDLPQASDDYLQITTIRQPLQAIGQLAMELMTRILNEGLPEERVVTVQTELIIRKSTGPVRSG